MRLQLALNVANIDEAIAFYSEMFASPVHKTRPGYANFEIDQPPLKLVLFEHPEAKEHLNHIGVECLTEPEFDKAAERLHHRDLAASDVGETGCCHARQSKFWVKEPGGLSWEWYRILDDDPVQNNVSVDNPLTPCCGHQPNQSTRSGQVCCA